MTESEHYKWLWSRNLSSSQEDKLIEAVAEKGDLETLKWFFMRNLTTLQENKIANAMIEISNKEKTANFKTSITRGRIDFRFDFFICHASEDKTSFVRQLAEKLRERGFKVWYDEFTLTLGDSLRRKIDYGLANSCFGIVVLSKHFFEKDWPQKELDGLVARERDGKKVILPIWHGVTRKDVEKFSPILAGRLAASTHRGIDYILKKIVEATK